MKYTFINQKGKQQTVEIPDAVIAQHKRDLGISTTDAMKLYLFDKGYISNDEAEALTEKAKGAGVKVKGAGEGKRQVKRKEDPFKRAIIDTIYQFMLAGGVDKKLILGKTVGPIEVTNPERVIAFQIGQDKYELTLSKKRQ